MNTFRILLVLLSLGLLPGSLAAQTAGADLSAVVLKPGDAVQITVWRQPELSGEFTLAADGSVDHPLYQAIRVAGIPLGTARERLHEFLKGWEAEPHFLVKPLFRVAVGGEVERPNLYTFPPEVTIAQAVAAAGGVTERGRLDQVRVLRLDGQHLVVDLSAGSGELAQQTVRSGDQIFIERSRMANFRDYVAPAGSLAMAAVTLLGVFLR